ncbi:MAG: hypothetical protein HRU20_23015 [Pseudomonadales bacterium]|nr:hypothetical protein [Pseudomonadales bacterium]
MHANWLCPNCAVLNHYDYSSFIQLSTHCIYRTLVRWNVSAIVEIE